jgi:hypothetical protein
MSFLMFRGLGLGSPPHDRPEDAVAVIADSVVAEKIQTSQGEGATADGNAEECIAQIPKNASPGFPGKRARCVHGLRDLFARAFVTSLRHDQAARLPTLLRHQNTNPTTL